MFEVINPAIVGRINVKYDSGTALDAAKKFWNELTKLVTNEIPVTYITLKGANKELSHFQITENKTDSMKVEYMISNFSGVKENAEKRLLDVYEKIKSMSKPQKGGKREDDNDDSSSSSSSSDDRLEKAIDNIRYNRKKQPIVFYHYVSEVYGDKVSAFIPVLIYPYNMPYVEVGFSTAFWG